MLINSIPIQKKKLKDTNKNCQKKYFFFALKTQIFKPNKIFKFFAIFILPSNP